MSIGCTKGYFQSLEKSTVPKGMLTILVITGNNSSRHTDRIDARIGSSWHDFLFDKAGLRTSSSDNSEILDSIPWIPDVSYRFPILSVQLVFLIPIFNRIPYSWSSIPTIPNSPSRNLLDFGIRITLQEARNWRKTKLVITKRQIPKRYCCTYIYAVYR